MNMEALIGKHQNEDRENALLTSAIRNKLGDVDSGLVGLEIKHLWEDMAKERYDVIEDSFTSIKEKLSDIPEVSSLISTIEAGINDKEASKYDASLKAIRILKESLGV